VLGLRVLGAGLLLVAANSVQAQATPFKIGFILPMTGQQASTGKQIDAAIKLWQAQTGTTVAGRKVEVILNDDGGVPDMTKRIAQEMVVNDKVDVLAGFGITPSAFATAPIATQSKTPMVVTAAATSAITEQSPWIVRTSFTLPQVTVPMADWATGRPRTASSPPSLASATAALSRPCCNLKVGTCTPQGRERQPVEQEEHVGGPAGRLKTRTHEHAGIASLVSFAARRRRRP